MVMEAREIISIDMDFVVSGGKAACFPIQWTSKRQITPHFGVFRLDFAGVFYLTLNFNG